VHAAPDALRVEVRDDDGRRLAFAEHLKRAGPYLPMTRLQRDEESVTRSDGWPQSADIGRVVVLAGGEAGMLLSWWNSAAGDEWRWSVEFYNRRA
jgi:hypothetical protein